MSTTVTRLLCDALPGGFLMVEARGREAMNAMPSWDLRIRVDDPSFDPDGVVGADAVVQLIDEDEGTARVVNLVVVHLEYSHEGRDGHYFSVTLAPREWTLTQRSGYRIFLDETAPDIVGTVLSDAGIPAADVVRRLSASYAPRPHCTQYDETEWAFVERLLAEEGISYWFDADDEGRPRLVLGDDPGSHDGISGDQTVPFSDPGGNVSGRHLFELEITGILTPTKVHVRDFDVRAPDVFIEGQAGDGPWEHFEYPASVVSSDAASQRAQARVDQLRRLERSARGASDCVRLSPGRLLTLEGCADEWMNGRYLIVAVEHDVCNGTEDDTPPRPYGNRVELSPVGDFAHRPAVPARAPKVDGVETATTTGPAGQEIHVDDLGRVKIRFPWDRSGITDDKSSYWVRCLQMNMGGSMLLPRVGWEVPVAYVDGNPDKPFVLGRLYNATAVVPYGLPGGKATTTLQSATSPGGGTTNEIRLGDVGGSQEMFIHATKDQTITVGGSADATVSADETHDVGLSFGVAVKGTQSATIGASQSVNVATDYGTTAKGSRTEMVGGMELYKITGNRVVHAKGAYSELVGAAYVIQCNQSNTNVSGAYTQLIGGTLSLAAGLGTGETVAAARTELVGGSRSIVAAKNAGESVIGLKSLTAGATTEKAGGAVVTTTKVAGSIKVGGSAKLKAGDDVVIDAASITINVSGSLDAVGFKMSGGTLKVKKGTSKLKGTIKHTGNSKLEA